MTAVRVDGLTKLFHSRRGPVRAVDGISFTVDAGEIFGRIFDLAPDSVLSRAEAVLRLLGLWELRDRRVGILHQGRLVVGGRPDDLRRAAAGEDFEDAFFRTLTHALPTREADGGFDHRQIEERVVP